MMILATIEGKKTLIGMKKIDVSIVLLNVIEKGDIALYGFLAPIMGPIFFPGYGPVEQLIFVYAISATSLVSRPCGVFLFAMLAPYYGPLQTLLYAVIGVACTTMMIGCIPCYEIVGWIAPVSLIIIRFLRDICSAGESSIAKLYIMEGKDNYGAVRASYWYQCSSMIGIIIASYSSTVIITTYPQAWRGCFFVAGFIAFVAYYLRLAAYNDVTSVKKREKNTIYSQLNSVWHEKVNVLRVAIVTIFSHVTYAIPFVFMNSFVPLITDISLATMMQYNTFLLLCDMLMIPSVGYCIYRYNARGIMMFSSVLLAGTIIPLFYFLPSASLQYIVFVRAWIVFLGVIFLCPLNFWCKQLFHTSSSYFLVGMGSMVGAATLGRITTPVCLWLWYATDWVCAPALYMACIMMLTAWAVKSSK